jgi:hypothetical protein
MAGVNQGSYENTSLAPSGVGVNIPGDQINAPIAVSLGDIPQTTTTNLTGTQRNTPNGPPIFRLEKYSLMYNAYYAVGGFLDGTVLHKSQVEKDDQFLERRATTPYRNFFRPIVDATYIPVFASGATRRTTVNSEIDEDGHLCPLWNDFLDDCDCRKSHIQKFVKKIIKHARMLGVSFVVVDNFPQTPVLTQDALKGRLYPYCYMRLPQQVETKYTQVDEFTHIVQICFREAQEPEVNPDTGETIMQDRWKLWTKNYSVKMRRDKGSSNLMEIPGTKVVYNLNEVPVLPVISGEVEDGTVLPHPDFYSVMKSNWALYNIDSAQMRLIRAQMFPILCMPMDEGNESTKSQAINPLQGIYLPPDRDGVNHKQPFYLAPPIGPYQELATTTDTLKADLYAQAGQQGVTGVVKQAKSGVSQAYDFRAEEFVLKETALMAKRCEEAIACMFQLYVLSEKFDYDVIYEDSYSPVDKDSDIKMYGDYLALDAGPKARALALEQVTRSVFNDMDDEDLMPIIEEIKANAEEEQAMKDNPPEPTPMDPQVPQPEDFMVAMAKPPEQPAPEPKKVNKFAKNKKSLKKAKVPK